MDHVFSGETIDDIEHPTWASTTTSFSESCGSCLSRISSLCLDGKTDDSSESFEARKVPSHDSREEDVGHRDTYQQSHIVASQNFEESLSFSDSVGKCLTSGLNKRPLVEAPVTVSGSLQSLSSSTKTVTASPRSDYENQFYNTMGVAKALHRRRGLYRERAPSENALDFHKVSHLRESKLSHSLHDVSVIPSNGLKKPSLKSPTTGTSFSTLYSRNQSRDSGFIRSESLLSLSSGSRHYDHVQSKVKQYIQSIKDADALRRNKVHGSTKSMVFHHTPTQFEGDYPESMVDSELYSLVTKLQQDLIEKDKILLKLQEDYNILMAKYAEAENKIDKMRFGWQGSVPCKTHCSESHGNFTLASKSLNHRPLPRPLFQVTSKIEGDDGSETSSLGTSRFETLESLDDSCPSFYPSHKSKKQDRMEGSRKEVVISAPLRPISSLYCTSVRLDKIVPPLKPKPSSRVASISSFQGGPFSTVQRGDPSKPKQVSDINIVNAPSISGMEDSLQSTVEPIGPLPHEDSILKVERWQKSLVASSCQEHSQIDSNCRPMLCAVRKQGHSEIVSNGDGDLHFQTRTQDNVKHANKCITCGNKVECNTTLQNLEAGKNNLFSQDGSISASQLNDLELAKQISLILRDQDHVVPNCPEEDRSFQRAIKNLERKLNALKYSINIKTIVNFLDLLLEKVPTDECKCQAINKILRHPDSIAKLTSHTTFESSSGSNCCDDDQLLQCLEEVDDYSHQALAKTVSFLRVLDSNKCHSSLKLEGDCRDK